MAAKGGDCVKIMMIFPNKMLVMFCSTVTGIPTSLLTFPLSLTRISKTGYFSQRVTLCQVKQGQDLQ